MKAHYFGGGPPQSSANFIGSRTLGSLFCFTIGFRGLRLDRSGHADGIICTRLHHPFFLLWLRHCRFERTSGFASAFDTCADEGFRWTSPWDGASVTGLLLGISTNWRALIFFEETNISLLELCLLPFSFSFSALSLMTFSL